ncbi:FKBP-type peptidyl-prolyl cis-trans isomerase [Microbacterium sp. 10M-3C3]|uniref:FKBP-type peptidyl-prolyl cis-trans isomerase n=1 Tax=Microbacterium sp. 10M-3C3 TaxID=2483401 RepID=UPI000F631677|nr:FKBP-type peptidyl-prolyl cis-trans isomerase [Microbacterium sp. 10M-3C3]
MRFRPLVTLSLAAAAAVILAGCSGAAEPDASPSGTPGDLCVAAAPSGAASEAIQVSGDEGQPATATFSTPLDVTEVESTVVTEGSGDPVASGDYISYGLTAFDTTTGEQLGTLGYGAGELLPQQISPDSVLGQFFGCAPVGTRVATVLPSSDGESAPVAYVVDLLGVTPLTATGADQQPQAGFPTVELAEDGEPTITVPQTDPPTDVQLETLKLGDGATVEPGDTVLVQYKGVKWSDGSEFDSSWSRGMPASFPTTGVVDGFRQALENHTVGSQVLVVVPPSAGYGNAEGNELQNETLVFVVDILATQHPQAQ